MGAPTAMSDRMCKTLTACTTNQYETVPPSATSDRSCGALTECDEDAGEVEAEAPTATSDRKCRLSKEERHKRDSPDTCWFLKDLEGKEIFPPKSVNNEWSYAAIVKRSDALVEKSRCNEFRGRKDRGKADLLCGSANGYIKEACSRRECLAKCEELNQGGCCQFIGGMNGDARRLHVGSPEQTGGFISV